jgi:dTDP-4-amino-4,6-dideoxygalactose transaminase
VRKVIPVNKPLIDEKEVKAVTKVLKSGILTGRFGSGPLVKQLETSFAEFVNVKRAIAVNSGTAALHMALWVADVKAGDEVILPSFTFIATAEAVALVGAKPVFVDIKPNTYNIDADQIEITITDKTKAIIPVDLYGLPAEMDRIKEIADKHNLIVIEDAAQAHGASYKGKPPGSFADMACWSFYASKNMTTGEGGMVTTNNDMYGEELRLIRSHGEKEEYEAALLGHNYRMPEIEAAIGMEQFKKLPTFLAKRRKNAATLTLLLGKVKQLALPTEPKGCRSSWYLYTVRIRNGDAKDRDRIVEELKKKGVGAAVYYHTPIHQMPYYKQFGEYHLPNTEEIAHQVLSLPIHPGLTAGEVDYVANSLKKALKTKTSTRA